MSMTNPPIYTSWQNLERGQHLAVAGVFDDIHMTNAEAILSLQLENSKLRQRLTEADERTDVLETALKKISARCVAYIEAEREMPEPSVEVCQMIASAALKPAEPATDEHVCTGCGAKGWTANCSECVPY